MRHTTAQIIRTCYNPLYTWKGNAKQIAQQLRHWYGMRVTPEQVQEAIDAMAASEGNLGK